MLDGKCKEAFEKWFVEIPEEEFDSMYGYYANKYMSLDAERTVKNILNLFYLSPFSMQWGVYFEFFDSVDIHIWINWHVMDEDHQDIQFGYLIKHPPFKGYEDYFESIVVAILTRQQAQTESIKKACEIFNGD